MPHSVSHLPPEVQPTDSSPEFVQRAGAHLQLEEYGETVRVCRLGLLVKPTCIEGRLLLSLALLALDRPDEAVQELRVAIETNERSVLAHMLQGEALLRLEDPQGAHESLRQAAELDPQHPEIKELLQECEERLSEASYPTEDQPARGIAAPPTTSIHGRVPGPTGSVEQRPDARDETRVASSFAPLETHGEADAGEPTHEEVLPFDFDRAPADSDVGHLHSFRRQLQGAPRPVDEDHTTASWLASPEPPDQPEPSTAALTPANARDSEFNDERSGAQPRPADEATKRVRLDEIEGMGSEEPLQPERQAEASPIAVDPAAIEVPRRPTLQYDPHASMVDTRPARRLERAAVEFSHAAEFDSSGGLDPGHLEDLPRTLDDEPAAGQSDLLERAAPGVAARRGSAAAYPPGPDDSSDARLGWEDTGHAVARNAPPSAHPVEPELSGDDASHATPAGAVIASVADPVDNNEQSEVSAADFATNHWAGQEKPPAAPPSLRPPAPDEPTHHTREIPASAIHILPEAMPPLPSDAAHEDDLTEDNPPGPIRPEPTAALGDDALAGKQPVPELPSDSLDEPWPNTHRGPARAHDAARLEPLDPSISELDSEDIPAAPLPRPATDAGHEALPARPNSAEADARLDSRAAEPLGSQAHAAEPIERGDSLLANLADSAFDSRASEVRGQASVAVSRGGEAPDGPEIGYSAPSRTAALTDGGPVDDSLDGDSRAVAPPGTVDPKALSGARSGASADKRSWDDGDHSFESVVDESMLSAIPDDPSVADRPKRAKSSRAPLRRRRRRALAGALEALFDTRRGHGKIVLAAVCVGVIVLALGIGFTVRYWRHSSSANQSFDFANTLLRRGNYADYRQAAEIFAAISAATPPNKTAALAYTLTRALIPFEFGVEADDSAIATEVDEASNAIRAAIEVVEALGRGGLEDAGSLAFNARNLYPRSAVLQYLQGRIELLRGKPALAVEYFRRATQLQRGNALMLTALGHALDAAGDARAAERHFNQALKTNPKHVGALLGRARIAIAGSDYEAANNIIESILEGPRRPDASRGQLGWALVLKARTRVHRGEVREAQKLLGDARRSAPLASATFLDELAQLQIDVYSFAAAEEAATRASKMMPGRPYPLLLKARVYLAQGRAQEAWDVLKSDLIPPDIGNLLRARTLLALSQTSAARQQLASIDDERDLAKQLLQAEILAAEHNVAEAERTARSALDAHPENGSALTLLARLLLLKGGAVAEARSLLERAIENSSGAIDAELTLADTMLAEGRYRDAHQQLIGVMRRHTWLTPGSLRLAKLNFGRRDLAAAKTNLTAILRDSPNDQHAHLLLIRVLLAQRELAAAQQQLLRLRGIAPGLRDLTEARVALSRGAFALAASKLLSARQRRPNDPEPAALLTRTYLLDGKNDEAQQVVRAMRRRFGHTATYQLAKGRLALASAKQSSALRAFRRALASIQGAVRLPAEEAEVLLLLGRTYHEGEQLREALSYYRKAAKACQFCPDPHYRQGLALDELGQPNEAIKALMFAARLSPGMLQVYYELGKIYESHNKAQLAIKMYNEYLRRGPPEEFADQVRKTVERLERDLDR